MLPALERLRAGHAPALLAFEQENRAYFAASITDRGDAYFLEFDERLAMLLAEQDEGICHFHVLAEADGTIVGRINLIDVTDGSAELGYRIAERAAGRGLATAAVRSVCTLAAGEYGLTSLTARTTLDNAASRTVLERTGFALVGETMVAGNPGLRFVRELSEGAAGGG
jgi:ribosomal-protein-alanine N-acetyltransferase